MRASLVIAGLLLVTAMAGAETQGQHRCPEPPDLNGSKPPITDADHERQGRQRSAKFCDDVLEKRLGLDRGRMELFSSPGGEHSDDAGLTGSTNGRTIEFDLRW